MWKGNYRSMDNIKYGKGKEKLLTKIEEISGGKGHKNSQKLILNLVCVFTHIYSLFI